VMDLVIDELDREMRGEGTAKCGCARKLFE
jgi:hypothetical protein